MSETRKPVVLFVDHSALPGGGQLGLRRYAELTKSIDPVVLTFGPGNAFDGLEKLGVRVITLPPSGASPLAALVDSVRLRRRVDAIGAELVVANSTRAAGMLALTALRKQPNWVYHARDDFNTKRNSWRKLFALRWWILPKFIALLANSDWTASTVPPGIARRRHVRVAYPVSGARIRSARPNISTPLRILTLSRLDRWKGIHVLLEAMALIEVATNAYHFNVVIAGSSAHSDPSYAEELRFAATRLRSNVTFAGHVHDVDELLDSADVLVAVSSTPEPFGQVVVQGLAAGVVVIAADEGGPAEVLTGGSGILISPGSSEALAEELLRLARNPRRAAAISANAVARAEAFSDPRTMAAMDEALLEIYHRACSTGVFRRETWRRLRPAPDGLNR